MKIGLKLWSINKELIELASRDEDFDYIELYVVPDSFDEKVIGKIKTKATVIHAPTLFHGFNISDREKFALNRKIFDDVRKIADFCKSEYIIIHPSFSGEYAQINRCLNVFDDERICIENMPYYSIDGLKKIALGTVPNEIKQINCKHFCLDFAHAIKASISLNTDYKKNIDEFNSFKPKIYHLSDGLTDNDIDTHLSLGEGNFDLEYLVGQIGRDAFVTLETPKINLESLSTDKKNLSILKRLIEKREKFDGI